MIRLVFVREAISLGCFVWFILTQFFRELTEKVEVCSYVMQDSATAAAQQFLNEGSRRVVQ
jgi:hypothetical protein